MAPVTLTAHRVGEMWRMTHDSAYPDSLLYTFSWSPVATATSYNVRLVASNVPQPALGTDFAAAYFWDQLGAGHLTDTARLDVRGIADSVPVRLAVRSCDSVPRCGSFRFSALFWLNHYPVVARQYPVLAAVVDQRSLARWAGITGPGVWTFTVADSVGNAVGTLTVTYTMP
jgi:hypothetical protein